MSIAARPAGLHLLYSPGFEWFADRGAPELPETEFNSRLVEAAWHVPLLRLRAAGLFETDPLSAPTSSSSEAQFLQQQADIIDARLGRWVSRLPPEWVPTHSPYQPRPDEVDDIVHAPVWGNFIATFDALLPAMVFTNYCMLRMYVASVRMQLSDWLAQFAGSPTVPLPPSLPSSPLETHTHTHDPRRLFRGLVDEICATVPFSMGQYPSDFPLPPPHPPATREPRARDFLGAYLAYLPLATAARQPAVPPAQRAWLREQLRAIEEVAGCGLGYQLFEQDGVERLDDGFGAYSGESVRLGFEGLRRGSSQVSD